MKYSKPIRTYYVVMPGAGESGVCLLGVTAS